MNLKKFNKTNYKENFYEPRLKKNYSTLIIHKRPFKEIFPLTNSMIIKKKIKNHTSINFNNPLKINNKSHKNKNNINNIPKSFLPLIRKKPIIKLPKSYKHSFLLEKIYKGVKKVDEELYNVEKNHHLALRDDFSLIKYQESLINIFAKGNDRAFQDGTIDKIRKNFKKINSISMDRNQIHKDYFIEGFHFPKDLQDKLKLRRRKEKSNSSHL